MEQFSIKLHILLKADLHTDNWIECECKTKPNNKPSSKRSKAGIMFYQKITAHIEKLSSRERQRILNCPKGYFRLFTDSKIIESPIDEFGCDITYIPKLNSDLIEITWRGLNPIL